MSDFIGYISSFFVTFGLASGFVIGGIVFLFGLAYAITLLFKGSRRAIREDNSRSFSTAKKRLVPVHHAPRRPGQFKDRR